MLKIVVDQIKVCIRHAREQLFSGVAWDYRIRWGRAKMNDDVTSNEIKLRDFHS